MMANRVFEDRLGIWNITPSKLDAGRLARIRGFDGGIIDDVFLPRSAERRDFERVRAHGLHAHLWTATDGRGPDEMARDTLADIRRVGDVGVDLNVEVPDRELREYMIVLVRRIRAEMPGRRLRLNIAPFKAFALPIPELYRDRWLYVCEQTYDGGMGRFSEADCYADLVEHGVPPGKATLCHGAAGPVRGAPGRVCTLPYLGRRRRGVIFSDDLLAEVGLL